MEFDVLIEIPADSSVKYEINEDTGELRADRFLSTAMTYPFNYGYVKDSEGEDGDPLDVIVISSEAVLPDVLIKCRPLGVLKMTDEAGSDNKIIAVPTKNIDPDYSEYHNIKDVPDHILEKIKHFFDHMKELEPGKWVKTGKYQGAKEAKTQITKALNKSTIKPAKQNKT